MSCARTRTSVGPPRWTWPSTCSTACWTWDARPTSASPDPQRGWGQCAHSPDPCNTAPHGLMAHGDAAGRQHLFHHAQAQGEAEVEPHGVADDLAWKAVAGVGGLSCGCHAGPLPVPTFSAKPPPKLTVPLHRKPMLPFAG